jgi:hypothetical protein
MTRLGRHVLAVWWLAAALLASGIAPSTADEAKPRALIALFESTRVSLPQGPLPMGLRFVLYDDGQIITRSGPTQADPDPPGRGVTYGQLDRAEAESLRQAAATDLKGVAAVDSGNPSLAEAGTTTLEVWDGSRYQRFRASVWPCQAEGRAFSAAAQRNRQQTDPAFLKVCDRLMDYKIAAPRPWLPKAVQLLIGAMDGPGERQVEWPKIWPTAPSALKPKAAVPLCAPVSAEPGDFSNALVTARWGEIGRTALIVDANTAAVIWDWYFDLPAEIPMVDEKGEPEPSVGKSCAAVARP